MGENTETINYNLDQHLINFMIYRQKKMTLKFVRIDSNRMSFLMFRQYSHSVLLLASLVQFKIDYLLQRKYRE